MTPSRPPCPLPSLPAATKIIGYPSGDDRGVLVSKSDIASIAAYIVGLQEWTRIAAICLAEPHQ